MHQFGAWWNPVSAAKKAARAARKAAESAERVAKATAKAAKTGAKLAWKLHKLPVQLIIQLSLTAAKVVCSLPLPVQISAAVAAGVPPTAVPIFCQAVKRGHLNQIRKLLPQMMKVAANAAAAKLRVASQPGQVRGFAGFNAGEIELLAQANEMSILDLAQAVDELTDEELGAALGSKWVSAVPIGLGAVAIAWGLVLAFRR